MLCCTCLQVSQLDETALRRRQDRRDREIRHQLGDAALFLPFFADLRRSSHITVFEHNHHHRQYHQIYQYLFVFLRRISAIHHCSIYKAQQVPTLAKHPHMMGGNLAGLSEPCLV